MMQEKKIKEELRGYVGAPLQHPRLEDSVDDGNMPLHVQQPSDRSNELAYKSSNVSPHKSTRKGY
jgi:hypothetical protein